MPNDLKIIIPAAGIGKRLQPHTLTTPKPLLPVAGKSMLAHILDPLVELDPAEVVLVVGHLGDQIVDYVEENYSFKSTFIKQEKLLGLGYAVNLAMQVISPGPVLIILSDTIAKIDYKQFINSGENVIALKEVDDPRRFGIAITQNGKIVEFEEKPPQPRSNLAIIGLYYIDDSNQLKKHAENIIKIDKRTSGEIQLTDILDSMLSNGNDFKPYVVDNWYDCGKIETILNTNRLLLREINQKVDIEGSKIIEPVSIDRTAVIKNSTIGPNVSISAFATISNSEINDSIISNNAVIENCSLEKSIIGEAATIKGKNGSLNVARTE
ncbi:MAG: NTP transferase domain-containing protein [candidate division Zixibacteria bacterium]|nr:NTP transferase domain-containing protein [candidate division Zixibacteria bacterium]